LFRNHVELLRCPRTGSILALTDPVIVSDGRIQSGTLVNADQSSRYPIIQFIPRFVDATNYCESFSVEWENHSRTLHKQFSGYDFSEKRYYKETRWGTDLKGEMILEAGCGSGSFTPYAVKSGATIVSFDLSRGVEANYQANGGAPNLLIVQADIYHLPFVRRRFDKVFCFGVLQHTPDPKAAFFQVASMLRPGGNLATDIYMHSQLDPLLCMKYWLRERIDRSNPARLYNRIKWYINIVWWPTLLLRYFPRLGPWLCRSMLIDHDFCGQLRGAETSYLKEMNRLNIFDMLSPAYDFPQTLESYAAWHQEAGLHDIDVCHGYNGIEGHATSPPAGTNAHEGKAAA
jgi:SAM-dependent methyltransferase